MTVFIAVSNDRILDVYQDPVRAHDRLMDEMDHAPGKYDWVCLQPFNPEHPHEVERWHTPEGPIARLSVLPFPVCDWPRAGVA